MRTRKWAGLILGAVLASGCESAVNACLPERVTGLIEPFPSLSRIQVTLSPEAPTSLDAAFRVTWSPPCTWLGTSSPRVQVLRDGQPSAATVHPTYHWLFTQSAPPPGYDAIRVTDTLPGTRASYRIVGLGADDKVLSGGFEFAVDTSVRPVQTFPDLTVDDAKATRPVLRWTSAPAGATVQLQMALEKNPTGTTSVITMPAGASSHIIGDVGVADPAGTSGIALKMIPGNAYVVRLRFMQTTWDSAARHLIWRVESQAVRLTP